MTGVLAATPTQKSTTSLRSAPSPNNYITATEPNYYTTDASNQDYTTVGGGGRSSGRARRSSRTAPAYYDNTPSYNQSNQSSGWYGSSQSNQQQYYPSQASSSGNSQGGIRGFFSRIFHFGGNDNNYNQPSGLRPSRYNGYTQAGAASWYGTEAHGGPTASGERFDMNDMTAAHRSLPFGTLVQVTNMRNGSQCVVRINDRGPYVGGRIIDLSRSAAQQLGMIGSGTANIQMTVLGMAN